MVGSVFPVLFLPLLGIIIIIIIIIVIALQLVADLAKPDMHNYVQRMT